MRSLFKPKKAAKQLRSTGGKLPALGGGLPALGLYLRSKKQGINEQRRTNFINGKKYKQAPGVQV